MSKRLWLSLLAVVGIGGPTAWITLHKNTDAEPTPAGQVSGATDNNSAPLSEEDFEKKKVEIDKDDLRAMKNNIKGVLIALDTYAKDPNPGNQAILDAEYSQTSRRLSVSAGRHNISQGLGTRITNGEFFTSSDFFELLKKQCINELVDGIGIQGPESLMPESPAVKNPDVEKVVIPTHTLQALLRNASSSKSPDTRSDAISQLHTVEKNMHQKGFETKLTMHSDTGIYSLKYWPVGTPEDAAKVISGDQPLGRTKTK